MQKSWGVFRSNSQIAILFSLSFWMSVAEHWEWWAQQRAQGWSPRQARHTGAVHTLCKGVRRASHAPLCCNSENLSHPFPPWKCKEMTECSEGCWHCPCGDGWAWGVLALLCSAAPASPPVLVRKGFSSLKISSWCLESVCGSVCLMCNLNLIARAS